MPLLFTLFFILSLLVKSDMLYDQIIDWTGRALPGGASRSVETMVARGRENLGEITLIAGVSYLLAGSRFFSSLDRAFSTISRTPRRPFVQRKLASFVMVPLVSLLMILAAFAAAFSTVMLALPDRIFESGTPAWFTGLLTLSLSLGLNFLVALALYTIVPVQKPRWGAVWKGSAVAALLFHLLGQLFPLYLQLTGGFSAYGGAFAFALVLMLWFYLLGQIIVVGAEVNALAAGRGNAPVADEG
jgi:membrane protein